METDILRGDFEHGFWLLVTDDLVISNVREDYRIYASAEGLQGHHAGKEIGDGFGTVEEVIEQLRDERVHGPAGATLTARCRCGYHRKSG
jgi:hypothetical protein